MKFIRTTCILATLAISTLAAQAPATAAPRDHQESRGDRQPEESTKKKPRAAAKAEQCKVKIVKVRRDGRMVSEKQRVCGKSRR